MGIEDEVRNALADILTVPWNERDGTVIPETDQVVFKNGAVKVNATYLYADLADSTGLAQRVNKKVGARIIRAYLNASARIIRDWGGAIRSYDGDRVMGIFIGNQKNNQAARAALGINWAYCDLIKPTVETRWPKVKDLWDMGHAVGVATGDVMIVRGGVVGHNDLVSVGEAPNVAAKLSDIRTGNRAVYITSSVYNVLKDPAKLTSTGEGFWKPYRDEIIGGRIYKVYRSRGWKKP